MPSPITSIEVSIPPGGITLVEVELAVGSPGLKGDPGVIAPHAASHTFGGSDPVTLTKAQVGLGNVDNTADASKPVSTAQATADTAIGAAAATDASTKANAALAAANGAAPGLAPVQSVAGRTGTVVLVKADVGLGNVDNTPDTSKPVSTAQATADTAIGTSAAADATTKANAALSAANAAAPGLAPVQSVAGRTGTVVLVKGDVGLGNVDNTADASKPVSTAQATADTAVATAATVDATTKASAALVAANAAAPGLAPVQSVAGRTGTVVLVKGDVGLGNVDNTADASKPVSAAQATADTAIGTAAASDATTKANAAQAAAVQRSNHTGSQLLATLSDLTTQGLAIAQAVSYVAIRTLLSLVPGTDVAAFGDSRMTNARTPTAHAASHAAAGSDPLTLSESQVSGLTADLAAKAALSGATFTGPVDFGGQAISNFLSSRNAQTGTTYTLLASDLGKIVTCSNSSAITVTCNTSFPDQGSVTIGQKGAGQVTISVSGLTIRSHSSFTKTAGQWASITLFRDGTDLWLSGEGA